MGWSFAGTLTASDRAAAAPGNYLGPDLVSLSIPKISANALYRLTTGLLKTFRVQANHQGRRKRHGAGDQARSARLMAPGLGVSASGCSLIVILDRDWRVIRGAPGAAELLGRTQVGFIGADLRDLLNVPDVLKAAVATGLDRRTAIQLEVEGLLGPGRLALCRVQPSVDGAILTVLDIGRRPPGKSLPTISGDTPSAPAAEMLLLNERGVIIAYNAICGEVLERVQPGIAATALGEEYLNLWERVTPEADATVIRHAVQDLLSGRSHRFAHTFVIAGRASGEYILHVEIMALRVGGGIRLVVLHEDLTKSAHAEAALRVATEQLLRARDDERQRIAIELHDSTSQHLVAAGLGVAKLRRILGPNDHAGEVIEDVSHSLQEAMKEIRVLSYLMKPSVVSGSELEAAARSFVTGFGRRTGLNTVFRAEGPISDVNDAVAHTAFRVLQESSSNVYRHANARGLEVEMAVRSQTFTLRVADDGRGMDAPAGLGAGGVGIASMQMRMDRIGGRLEISCDSAGTVVLATCPLDA